MSLEASIPTVCRELTMNPHFLDHAAPKPTSNIPADGSQGESVHPAPTSPSTPSTLLSRSPHVAAGEFSPSNSALGTEVGAGALPEQKIFPGIVHERARKGNMQ